jgi:Transposase
MAVQWSSDERGLLCGQPAVSTTRNDRALRGLLVKTVPSLAGEEADGWWDGVPRVEHCSIRLPRSSSWPTRSTDDGRDEQAPRVLFVGVDWAERHHDVCLMAADGQVVASERVADGVAGLARLHERTKSDRGDARMLADLVRTDRHHHRRVAGDSGQVEAVKVLARGHQQLVWARQRQANLLRSALRAFYPAAVAAFGADLAGRDAVAVLGLAPTLTVAEGGRAWSWPRCCARLGVDAGSTPARPASRRR